MGRAHSGLRAVNGYADSADATGGPDTVRSCHPSATFGQLQAMRPRLGRLHGAHARCIGTPPIAVPEFDATWGSVPPRPAWLAGVARRLPGWQWSV